MLWSDDDYGGTQAMAVFQENGASHEETQCFYVCLAVRRLQSKGILIQMFPLHHQDELKRLSFSWYKKVKLSLQPLGE